VDAGSQQGGLLRKQRASGRDHTIVRANHDRDLGLPDEVRGHQRPATLATKAATSAASDPMPSGFERFFRDFGHPARLDDVQPLAVQEAEIQRVTATARQYGMDIVRGTG
jgi:hypothetical protein